VAGTVTPRGLATTYKVEFGETTAYGQTSDSASTASATPADVTVQLSGLKPETTYHYRFVGQSPDGSATGDDGTFTTSPLPPSLSALAVKPSAFRVGRGATAVTAKRVPRGTTISYRLSTGAKVTLTVQRVLRGVKLRSGGKTRCVPATKRNLRRVHGRPKRCTLYRGAGVLNRNGVAGANSLRFTGRIGKRALKPGSYRLVVVARNVSGASRSARRRFKIVSG
jgi:phosphodiesterase/alkaline phosphatase D-like protein